MNYCKAADNGYFGFSTALDTVFKSGHYGLDETQPLQRAVCGWSFTCRLISGGAVRGLYWDCSSLISLSIPRGGDQVHTPLSSYSLHQTEGCSQCAQGQSCLPGGPRQVGVGLLNRVCRCWFTRGLREARSVLWQQGRLSASWAVLIRGCQGYHSKWLFTWHLLDHTDCCIQVWVQESYWQSEVTEQVVWWGCEIFTLRGLWTGEHAKQPSVTFYLILFWVEDCSLWLFEVPSNHSDFMVAIKFTY